MMTGRFGTWPITVRVVLVTAALMILLGVIASQQVLSTLGRLQNDRLQEFARLHLEGLAVALGPFALHKDIWEVYDTLDRARISASGERIRLTVVADENGRVLAATDPVRAPIDASIEAFSNGAHAIDDVTAGSGESVVRVAAPLVVQGRNVGLVVSELDISDLVAERRTATLALLAGNAAATVIVVLAGYIAVARILEPIELLARHMGEAGDAPRPIPEAAIPRSDTLLSRLLRNFNDMAGAIDARREVERRLAERERFVSLGRLASSLAHEINNPLGGLVNAADTIRAYADRPEVVRRSADLLDRGLRHLRDVSRVILEENRLDRSARPLSSTDFDDLRLLFEPETVRRRQRLGWQIPPPQELVGHYPSAAIRQISLNLLLNAASAAPEGGEVSFTVACTCDHLHLTVTDNGPGLSPAALDRLVSAAPLAPGGGVGLRLVRDLVLGLDGDILHERRDGRTLIRVIVPSREQASC
ncbi:signal transduction histidine kinase [Tepidamorphus gemmatus]|uniref:histidine kinase n=1 Tax=Tepidamorphus gemmatus TaxID=747076 RepID=A0A4V2UZA6_9HYPH|nr:HAMP domain-containing sensor histidine kinase [Tepidamorphus gemmatus]TCT10558.1 signal transduction histidine kinase [Tepidamorphus gemmatus]